MHADQAQELLPALEFTNLFLGGRLPTYKLAQECVNKISYIHHGRMRRSYIRNFGFTLLTHDVISELVQFIGDKKVADVGCGTGYITHYLRMHGASVTPIDTHESLYSIESPPAPFKDVFNVGILNVDGPTWVRENAPDVVIMSWPDHRKSTSIETIRAMPVGSYLIHSGDSYDGCTGCDEFYHALTWTEEYFTPFKKLNERLDEISIQFDGMRDSWSVYKKIKELPDDQFVFDEDVYERQRQERLARAKEYAVEVASDS